MTTKLIPARPGRMVRIFLIGLMLGRCGHRNDNSAKHQEDRVDAIGKELAASCASLSGRIEWQDEASSSVGAEILLLDHTRGVTLSRLVKPDGTYLFECGNFAEKSIMSLHLVKDHRLIGDFDFSEVLPGIQAAFSYAGGVGYDLGRVVVPRNSRGDISFLRDGLSARIGGGFRVNPEINIDVNTFGQGALPLSLTVASQVVVTSPLTILQSFYLADQNFAAYQRDLTAFSRLHFLISSGEVGFVRRANLSAETSWLRFARIPKADDSGPGAEFWAEKRFELRQDSDLFRKDVFPGFIPKVGDIAYFHVFKSAGSFLTIPRFVDKVVLFPPMVTAFGTGEGGGVTAIDYREQSQKNGLTRPFCEDGDLRFSLEPPRDGLPGSPGTTFLAEGPSARIRVRLDYFADGSGATAPLGVEPEDFSGAFRGAHTETVGGIIRRDWDPDTRELTFSVDQGLFGEKTLTIPSGILPGRAGGHNTHLIRLRIYWEDGKSLTGGGTALWVKKVC